MSSVSCKVFRGLQRLLYLLARRRISNISAPSTLSEAGGVDDSEQSQVSKGIPVSLEETGGCAKSCRVEVCTGQKNTRSHDAGCPRKGPRKKRKRGGEDTVSGWENPSKRCVLS